MSLQQPQQKMSKSSGDPRSRILITDTPEEIRKKIMAALTDSQNSVSYDSETRPGVSNLLDILSAFDAEARTGAELAESFANSSLRDLKETVSESTVRHLSGIREQYLELLSADEGRYLDAIEVEGAKQARANAEETMQIVRSASGL
jgi:tryptophanyl-tRNA synthetase